MSHHIIPCHVLSYGTILYHILSYHVNSLDIIYDTYCTSYYISYYHVLFIMYHLLLIIRHAPHITYDIYIYMIYHGSVRFYHCKLFNCIILFCQVISIVHHIMSYIYLTMLHHLMHSHHVHPPSLDLVSISKRDSPCVHQVFDVLFYMDAEGQSYDLRQTPLKAPQKWQGHSVEAEDWAQGIWVSTPNKFGVLGWRTWIFLGKVFGRPRHILSVNWLSRAVWGQHLSIETFERWEQWKSH